MSAVDDAIKNAEFGSATAWVDITGKPDEFNPAAHTHNVSNLLQSGATTGQLLQWNGTEWVPATVASGGKDVIGKVKTDRQTVISSVALQNDNNYSFTLKANTTYAINADLSIIAPSTGGIKWAFTVPNGASGRVNTSGNNDIAHTTLDLDITTGRGSNTSLGTGANHGIKIWGFITTTDAGTLTFQWAQNTSNETGTYIERGSTMTLIEV